MIKRRLLVVTLAVMAAFTLAGRATQFSAQASGTATPASTAPATPSGPTATPIERNPGHVLLATTTSTQDSGLLDYILPDFQKKYNVIVDVIAVGTGQSLQI